MLHGIGRKPRKEGDLVDALLACHGRIRTFTDLAVTVSERADLAPSDVAESCARIGRYFVEAFPLHVEDEESSLEPRLEGRSPEVDAALGRMRGEHAAHADAVRRLTALSAALAADPSDAEARATLGAVARSLRPMFEEHLEAEERVLFPALRSLLSPDEERLVRSEMAARRAQR